jgi:hypothetical protein
MAPDCNHGAVNSNSVSQGQPKVEIQKSEAFAWMAVLSGLREVLLDGLVRRRK